MSERIAADLPEEELRAHADHLDAARDIFVATALDDEFVDFLTVPAYAEVVRAGE